MGGSVNTGSEESYLVRLGPPGRGDVIHRNTCTYARRHRNAVRWLWAERPGNDPALVPWLNPCGHCKPYEKAPLTAKP